MKLTINLLKGLFLIAVLFVSINSLNKLHKKRRIQRVARRIDSPIDRISMCSIFVKTLEGKLNFKCDLSGGERCTQTRSLFKGDGKILGISTKGCFCKYTLVNLRRKRFVLRGAIKRPIMANKLIFSCEKENEEEDDDEDEEYENYRGYYNPYGVRRPGIVVPSPYIRPRPVGIFGGPAVIGHPYPVPGVGVSGGIIRNEHQIQSPEQLPHQHNQSQNQLPQTNSPSNKLSEEKQSSNTPISTLSNKISDDSNKMSSIDRINENLQHYASNKISDTDQ